MKAERDLDIFRRQWDITQVQTKEPVQSRESHLGRASPNTNTAQRKKEFAFDFVYHFYIHRLIDNVRLSI